MEPDLAFEAFVPPPTATSFTDEQNPNGME